MDLTGRSQFARNVVVSWAMHLLVLAAGFIVPRQISDNLGQEALGIWDLGWVTVRYLSLTNLGIVSSLTRYVALYVAQKDFLALSKATTAVVAWQAIIATLVLLASFLLSWGLVSWVDIPDSYQQNQIRLVLFLLGASLVVDMLAAPAGGIITGCHRWDIQHTFGATHDFGLAIALISVMAFDGSLVDMAGVVVCVAVVIGIARIIVARNLMPQISVRPNLWEYKVGIKMLGFGTKTILAALPQFLVFQIPAMLLAGFAGPAALAVLNRGLALMRHCHSLVSKVNKMFVPMTSGLLGLEKNDEAKAQLIYVGGYSMSIVLPMAMGLICYGDLILLLWMGEGYDNWLMLTILVSGAILPISQDGVVSVMQGLNAHGRMAVYSIIATMLALGVGIPFVFYIGWSVNSAAMVSIFAWVVGRGLVIPYFLKYHFQISLRTYLMKAILLPLFYNIPLIILLVAGRFLFDAGQWQLMLACWVAGGIATLFIYWYCLVPKGAQEQLLKQLKFLEKWNGPKEI